MIEVTVSNREDYISENKNPGIYIFDDGEIVAITEVFDGFGKRFTIKDQVHSFGYSSDTWHMINCKPFRGKITLENKKW